MTLDSLNWCNEVLLNCSKPVLPNSSAAPPQSLPSTKALQEAKQAVKPQANSCPFFQHLHCLQDTFPFCSDLVLPASPRYWAYVGDCCWYRSCSCPTLRVTGRDPAPGFVSVTLPASPDSPSLPSTSHDANSPLPLPVPLPWGPFGQHGAITAEGCPDSIRTAVAEGVN